MVLMSVPLCKSTSRKSRLDNPFAALLGWRRDERSLLR